MNLCFFIGKIISNIEFKFIINNKNIAIAIFQIELENKSIVNIKGYNKIADCCYQKLYKNDRVGIYGILNSKGEIEIMEIEKYS